MDPGAMRMSMKIQETMQLSMVGSNRQAMPKVLELP